MGFRMPRRVKDQLIKYVREYAKRILESQKEVLIINEFNIDNAAKAAAKALTSSSEITKHEKEVMATDEGYEKIKDFFEEKLVVNYFMMARNIEYHEAKSLLLDKGTEYFPETKGIISELYKGRQKDYKATDKQIEYIRSFGVEIKNIKELSGREASLIISCLKTPKKTKPAYYTYYIKNKYN